MSSVEWFASDNERVGTAEKLRDLIGHKVCEGMYQANWYVKELGATCVLFCYDQRRIFQDGGEVVVDKPFYYLQALYKRDGKDAVVGIELAEDFSIPKRRVFGADVVLRSGEQRQLDIEINWDEAMGVGDEVLRRGLQDSLAKRAVAKPTHPSQYPIAA